APCRAPPAGRHRLDQHLQRLRHGRTIRRLQAERLWPGDERPRARPLHAGEERLGGFESIIRFMIQRIAIIGAGTMGHGIAHAAIMAGYDTTMYDVAQPALDKGCSAIAAIIEKGVELGKVTRADAAAAKTRLETTTNLGHAMAAADLIIEAAPEAMDLKLSLLVQIEKLAPANTLIA